MALFTEYEIRARAQTEARKAKHLYKSNSQILDSVSLEDRKSLYSFDIFLSHSFKDAELILGIKLTLEDLGHTVYVDWITDPQLNRDSITESTAEVLRTRMSSSSSLFYVTTDHATQSKWMPWECGFFDGLKGKVAIIPVKSASSSDYYKGQEYLGLYPYGLKARSRGGKDLIYIHKSEKIYLPFSTWVSMPREDTKWNTLTG
ncbi:toll-Interleukin receptor [Stutzerimonas stutzeri]|uniref:toll-Interleukin receptor n=1 Tax=Stutzerimonas stutzeri TaxID=316 RepID=UPI0015E46BC7|nr:toll-Interleukin receptor [Stutzerimonas stutzeri]MBA1225303.1 toll-Interleukin receptor [Stutzerimonas stutzeri]